jgi:predicted nucleic acid-binding protein
VDFVVDASMAAAWFFEDEPEPLADSVLGRLRDGTTTAAVPAIWPAEVVNALLVAERRGRTTEAKTDRFVTDLADLPVAVETADAALVGGRVLTLARRHHLTVYDATYLDLAFRLRLPLATLDTRLRKAAEAVGVPLAS